MNIHERFPRLAQVTAPAVAIGSLLLAGCGSSEPLAAQTDTYVAPPMVHGQYTANRGEWRDVTFFSLTADTYTYIDMPQDRQVNPLPKTFLYNIICGGKNPVIETVTLDTPEEAKPDINQYYQDYKSGQITIAKTERTMFKDTLSDMPVCTDRQVNRHIASAPSMVLVVQRLQRIANGDRGPYL